MAQSEIEAKDKHKQLENTPITKEWLEEHGFKKGYSNLDPEYTFDSNGYAIGITLLPDCNRRAEICCWDDKNHMAVTKTYYGRNQAEFKHIGLFTLADLYDVCKICNIFMNYENI